MSRLRTAVVAIRPFRRRFYSSSEYHFPWMDVERRKLQSMSYKEKARLIIVRSVLNEIVHAFPDSSSIDEIVDECCSLFAVSSRSIFSTVDAGADPGADPEENDDCFIPDMQAIFDDSLAGFYRRASLHVKASTSPPMAVTYLLHRMSKASLVYQEVIINGKRGQDMSDKVRSI